MKEEINRKGQEKFIDVERLFQEKNPGLAKVLPKFVFSYIKRILHQEEINKFLLQNKDSQNVDFLGQVISYFDVTYEIIGASNLPEHPRSVFAANHPLGGLEGIIMTKAIADHYGDARVPVNDILLSIKNFHPLFIPINKHGATSKEAIIKFDETYASDIPMLMFPSGYVSRKKKGVIKDIDWKKTFLAKAIKHNRSIIPTFISGQNSNFFYNLNIFREAIGIKANLEMFFLSNELFKQRGEHLKIYYGEEIKPSFFDKSRHPKEWAKLVQEYAYSLKDNANIGFSEFVSNSSRLP